MFKKLNGTWITDSDEVVYINDQIIIFPDESSCDFKVNGKEEKIILHRQRKLENSSTETTTMVGKFIEKEESYVIKFTNGTLWTKDKTVSLFFFF